MAFKIISEDEPLTLEAIVILIFGEPGIGKTSLSFTADEPLLEDYDEGLQRAVGRKKALKIDKWEDAVDFHNSKQLEELGIQTLIFDTVGTMLDNYISQAVIRDDPKNSKKDGSLALGGYGAMKNVFNAFVRNMKARKIDLIFIAHDDDENVKDSIKKKPKITGGSYDIIKGVADLVGYMETEGDQRVIDFNPCDRHVGKNSAQITKQVIPDFSTPEYGNFMGQLIQKCKDKMNEMSEAQTNAIILVKEIQGKITGAESIDDLNPVALEIEKMSDTYRIQLSKPLNEKYGVYFNEMLKEVQFTIQMDSVVELVKNAPELVKKHIRSSIMAKVRELGFKWNEEMGVYLDKTGKPSEPAEYDDETNTVDTTGENKKDKATNTATEQTPPTETDKKVTEEKPKDEKPKDEKATEDKPKAGAVAEIKAGAGAVAEIKTPVNSAAKNQSLTEPKIF